MSSETETVTAKHPFIRQFVLESIKVVAAKKLVKIDKEVIDADMVPRVSEYVFKKSMGPGEIPPRPKAPTPIKKPLVPRMHPRIANIPNRLMPRSLIPKKPISPQRPMVPPRPKMQIRKPMMRPPVPPKPVAPPRHHVPQRPHPPRPMVPPRTNPLKPKVNDQTGHIEGYGKINAFLEDPTITTIECPGPGKPVIIVRAGQRQITKIVLGPEEVSEILDTVADEAHIPLLEGVFRAAVDSFSISAVISEMIGSKFVIKKHTAYSALEK